MNLDSITTNELSELLCMTRRQVHGLVKFGLPSEGLGSMRRYRWRTVFQWYVLRKVEELRPKKVESGEDLNQSQELARKYAAEASRTELKLAKERGELVEVEKVKRAQMVVNATLRTRLLGVPTKVAPLVAVNGNLPLVKSVLETEIRELLTELSRGVEIGSLEDESPEELQEVENEGDGEYENDDRGV